LTPKGESGKSSSANRCGGRVTVNVFWAVGAAARAAEAKRQIAVASSIICHGSMTHSFNPERKTD
jgi:hypothetical protein